MKKIIKIISIIIISIILVYTLFVTEESIRLQKGGNTPLIILNGTCDDNLMYNDIYETSCQSIGFSIKRQYVYEPSPASDVRFYHIIKEEFWLFDKFLIWGWIS